MASWSSWLAASGRGEPAARLARLSSTTFDPQLAVARAVSGENPGLYFEIQRLNAFGAQALRGLSEAVARLAGAVAGGDEEAFVELTERGRAYLTGLRR